VDCFNEFSRPKAVQYSRRCCYCSSGPNTNREKRQKERNWELGGEMQNNTLDKACGAIILETHWRRVRQLSMGLALVGGLELGLKVVGLRSRPVVRGLAARMGSSMGKGSAA